MTRRTLSPQELEALRALREAFRESDDELKHWQERGRETHLPEDILAYLKQIEQTLPDVLRRASPEVADDMRPLIEGQIAHCRRALRRDDREELGMVFAVLIENLRRLRQHVTGEVSENE